MDRFICSSCSKLPGSIIDNSWYHESREVVPLKRVNINSHISPYFPILGTSISIIQVVTPVPSITPPILLVSMKVCSISCCHVVFIFVSLKINSFMYYISSKETNLWFYVLPLIEIIPVNLESIWYIYHHCR